MYSTMQYSTYKVLNNTDTIQTIQITFKAVKMNHNIVLYSAATTLHKAVHYRYNT